MNFNEQAKAWLRTVIHNHVGSNIRSYQWTTWTGEVTHNMLGGIRYLSPQEGKVVDENEHFLLVKTGPKDFNITLKSLLTELPAIGAKVRLQFYQLRRFDGTLADGSEDPAVNGLTTMSLTGVETHFPVRWDGLERVADVNRHLAATYREIQNPYLRDLIVQLETIRVDGGIRRAVNVLVDAGATDLDFVDPPEEESVQTPPAIRFRVNNAKLQGGVEVNYDRAMDYYRVNVTKPYPSLNSTETERYEDVDFEQLPLLLARLIDDGEWRKVKVTVLKPAPKAKKPVPELV